MSRVLTLWRQAASVVVAATVGVGGCAAKPTPAEQAEMRASLERALQPKRPPDPAEDGQRAQRVWKDVRSAYTANDKQLIWSDGRRPRSTIDSLIGALCGATLDGLDPADYRVDDLTAARDAFDRTRAVDLDVYFTAWEQDGALRAVPDVYGIDRRHDKATVGP